MAIEFSASGDFILSAKRGPVSTLGVHTQMLVGLAMCDEDSLVGL